MSKFCLNYRESHVDTYLLVNFQCLQTLGGLVCQWVHTLWAPVSWAMSVSKLWGKVWLTTTHPSGRLEIVYSCICYNKHLPYHFSPTPVISWYKNGVELPGDNSEITLESHNQELKFSSLSFADAGQYECRAENRGGPPATRPVHLTVECKFEKLVLETLNRLRLNIEVYETQFMTYGVNLSSLWLSDKQTDRDALYDLCVY